MKKKRGVRKTGGLKKKRGVGRLEVLKKKKEKTGGLKKKKISLVEVNVTTIGF